MARFSKVSEAEQREKKQMRDKRYREEKKRRDAAKQAAAGEGGADKLDERESVETAGDISDGEGSVGGNERGQPPEPVYAPTQPEPPRA